MSKVKYISLIISQFIIVLTLVININNQNESIDNENPEIVKKSHDTISMMLETDAGSGNYEMTTRDSWPTEGYVFNSTLSKCENGGELLWDDTTKKVVFNGTTSDKCYVYFDKAVKTIINEISTSDITTTSVTIIINTTKGTYDISKYYYSIDNGSTWNENISSKITISNLTQSTEYSLTVYVKDTKNINSEFKTINFTTLSPISFKIDGTTYYADPGMTWDEWKNSTYSLNFVLSDDKYVIYPSGYAVASEDVIVENTEYRLASSNEPIK